MINRNRHPATAKNTRAKGEDIGSGEKKTATAVVTEVPGLTASPKMLELAPGLYALSIGESKGRRGEVGGMLLPATHISEAMRGSDAHRVAIFPSSDTSDWIGPDGGTIVVKVPTAGGRILITTYRAGDQEAVPLAIQVARLDRPVSGVQPADHGSAASAAGAPQMPSRGVGERELKSAEGPSAKMVKAEIILQVEKVGEQRFETGQWAGNRGGKQRIEAFAVRPLAQISAEDVEYKAFGPNGRETPWVSDAKLCGSRGRGMALTGFAVRLSSRLREKFDAVYEGAFFENGISASRLNGEPCTSSRTDDPLEAVHIRLIERATE